MDNQHTSYKELTQDQIDLMNRIKQQGVSLGELFDDLDQMKLDHRWVAIAKTNLQQGLMAATRAVAQPDFF